MLSKADDLGPGVATVDLPDLWGDVERRLTGVFSQFFQAPIPEGFYPHFNEVSLRQALLGEVTELVELQQSIQNFLDSGYCALILNRTWVNRFPILTRNMFLYALSLALGYPTPSEQRRAKVLWDIRVA